MRDTREVCVCLFNHSSIFLAKNFQLVEILISYNDRYSNFVVKTVRGMPYRRNRVSSVRPVRQGNNIVESHANRRRVYARTTIELARSHRRGGV